MKYKFGSKVKEIFFFREIKPKFAAKLMYYNDVYNIAANKPVTSKKAIKKYHAAEGKRLQAYEIFESDKGDSQVPTFNFAPGL
ncbi:hypothetical protein FNO01nite_13980 [Flavobacterium noncentrifugens]|uniref:RteC domain-containing protein n=1 Tax=Flavobacterium noncentrifugens TaxID=1128970 RepID=UPI000B8390E1|nr:RteC domain-containing protein [Flavobacterium noncentrifugens]GEP50726.1 hypothetical protein FNO01nite_13980 [Flavobacterium noncentrifugens]